MKATYDYLGCFKNERGHSSDQRKKYWRTEGKTQKRSITQSKRQAQKSQKRKGGNEMTETVRRIGEIQEQNII